MNIPEPNAALLFLTTAQMIEVDRLMIEDYDSDLALLWLSGRLAPGQDSNDPEYADE